MNAPASSSRRDFLRASVLASAVFGTDHALMANDTRKASDNQGRPRNVIFMVSDGMNHGALTMAKNYRQLFEQKTTHWTQLYRERPVVRALVETFSNNSIVTDSAAAASAWGGGKRVNNGSINVLPDGTEVSPLQHELQNKGFKVGLVSTATITHATPAGFAANVSSRGSEETIAQQYLDRKVDVLLGGGQKFFSEDLRQKYRSAGYDLAVSRDELLRMPAGKTDRLLGIFSDSHIPFSIDRNNDAAIAAQIPTLAELTDAALSRLAPSPNGFFLMVEGARIDHASHQNDAATSIHDQLAFDDAIGTALKFIDKNPDTLLIITTDHGCGGIQMNGMSQSSKQGMAPGIYSASTAAFERLRDFKHSFEWMKKNGVDGLSGPKLAEALLQHTGIQFEDKELKDLQGLKLAASPIFQKYHGIGWTSGNHTGDLVEFCAFGPGSQHFLPFMENREVHDLVLKALAMA
jgi:alkaline phosphatase